MVDLSKLFKNAVMNLYKSSVYTVDYAIIEASKLADKNKINAKDYEEFMRYLDDKVLDHKNGSWFHQLDENNNVIGTVWPGKSDVYHAFQSTWIPYGTPYISIASDVKQYMEVCHQ